MSDQIFQEAYARVRSRYNDSEWRTLTGHQITEEIYREIRIIDAERNREKPNADDVR